MIDQCADCVAELDHCHGTLIVHRDSVLVECTEDGCFFLEAARHDMVIDCTSVNGNCDCAELPANTLLLGRTA